MGTTNAVSSLFKGTSSYSSDFANVIGRAVAIASLPVQQLTNDKATLTAQSDELTKLDTKFAALQTAVQKVATALSGSSYQTSVSTDKVLNVSVGDGAREGNYSMKITSIGAYESSTSLASWPVPDDPTADPPTYTLVVGNRNYTVTPADNSARALADAINANFGTMVQATTVNVKPGDTRISLKGVALGQTSLDILQIPADATSTSLQAQAVAGYAMSQSSETWDPSGSHGTYTLSIGGIDHSITMTGGNSAAEVVSAVNTAYGTLVRASVVDVGKAGIPDLRISLESTTAGKMSGSMNLDLKKAGSTDSLQTQQAPATSRTTSPWSAPTDAPGTRSTYNLVMGTSKLAFTPADNSAASVAAAINALYGDQVAASVVDLHTNGIADFRISLRSKVAGAGALDIQRSSVGNFQEEQTVGALASYEINNSGVVNSSNTRNIEISDGVTVSLLTNSPNAGTTPVDITVTRSTSALNTALSGFADAYNAASSELITQRGQGAGALGGQSIVTQLSSLLSNISTYSSSGQIGGLTALGLELGTDGKFTYNAFALVGADLASSTSVNSFLGSATGGGFLKLATNTLAGVQNTTTGLLKIAETDMKAQIGRLGATIADKQSKVDALQISMQNRMAKADALIASMQQQYSYFSNMFAAQQTADQMYR